jgi:hypothetical protein
MATEVRPTSKNKQIPREEALKRLAQKDVAPAYRGPRGNQDLDRDALAISVGASERLLTH